jgi:hypothetical protein
VSQQQRSTYVVLHRSEILAALVDLEDIPVACLERRGPDVDLIIEQGKGNVRCPSCAGRARIKERPVCTPWTCPSLGCR